jgi:hypothetical protein
MSTHVADLLGAWALDVCGDDEAATVEAHLGQCDECGSEATRLRAAVGWLGVERVITPPATLRRSILDEARRRRAPVAVRTLVEAYSATAALLHDALGKLDHADWRRHDPRHGDVAGVIRHLTANDAMLAGDLDLPRVSPARNGEGSVREAWRMQSQILLRGLGSGTNLDRMVTLAGKGGGQPGSLRDALVQRAFETWIHLEDVRRVAVPPSPERVRRIVGLAVGLLPRALAAQGLSWPGRFRLHLSGIGSGDWSFPLGEPDAGSGGEVAVTMEALEFTRLVASRHTAESVRVAIEGDNRVALQVLRIASTLGCD